MQQNNLFEEGGMLQEGGTIDPVSGNEVPVGSLQEEVRDDLDVRLSEGEFVIPADVVRYIGLERLMKLRDEAKKGLARMAEIGQMGNAQEVENPDQLHGGETEEEDYEGFESDIDEIIQEVDEEEMGARPKEMAVGGMATGGALPMLTKYGVPTTSVSNPAIDVRVFQNNAGTRLFVTFINGKPLSPVPSGYSLVGTGQEYGQPPATPPVSGPPATTTIPTTTVPDVSTTPTGGGASGADLVAQSGGGGEGPGSGPTAGSTGATGTTGTSTGTTGSVGSVSISPEGVATANTTGMSNTAAGLAGLAISAISGIPGLSTVGQAINNSINNAANAAAASVNAAVADTQGINANTSTAAATAGPSGTGGNAAAAAQGVSAATSGMSGISASATAIGSQAAANAAISGMTVSDAVSVGISAAQSAAVAEAIDAAEAAAAANDAANAAAAEGNTSAEGTTGQGAVSADTAATAASGNVGEHGDTGTPGGDGDGGGGGGGDGSGCTDPETPIYISPTETKKSGDIVIGDTLYTVHEKTLEYGMFKVVNAKIIQEPKLLITFDDESKIKVSDTHKFLLSDGSWKEMYLLSEGAEVQTMRGINEKGYKTITNIEEIGKGDVVMLTVEDAHTYISAGLISHNMKARGGLVQRKKKATKTVKKGLATRK